MFTVSEDTEERGESTGMMAFDADDAMGEDDDAQKLLELAGRSR